MFTSNDPLRPLTTVCVYFVAMIIACFPGSTSKWKGAHPLVHVAALPAVTFARIYLRARRPSIVSLPAAAEGATVALVDPTAIAYMMLYDVAQERGVQ